MNFNTQAIEKIDKETKEFKGDKYGNVVYRHVAATLKDFCNQEDEFAQAIVQTEKTLSDCCADIMKGASTALSDIDVYKKAVQFYFPGAGINFEMTIDLCASVKSVESNDTAAPKGKIIRLSFENLIEL